MLLINIPFSITSDQCARVDIFLLIAEDKCSQVFFVESRCGLFLVEWLWSNGSIVSRPKNHRFKFQVHRLS